MKIEINIITENDTKTIYTDSNDLKSVFSTLMRENLHSISTGYSEGDHEVCSDSIDITSDRFIEYLTDIELPKLELSRIVNNEKNNRAYYWWTNKLSKKDKIAYLKKYDPELLSQKDNGTAANTLSLEHIVFYFDNKL